MNTASQNDTSIAVTGEVLDAMPPQELAVIGDNPYLRMIERVVDRGGDLSTLDKLFDLKIKWDADEARKAYVADMAEFKKEPMVIGKNKHVSFTTSKGRTEYDHAELSDVTEVVVPNLAKHGFSHGWKVTQANGAIRVVCTITHRLGHSESVEMTAPPDDSGGKNTIQSIGSTKSYLERYTLLAGVGMATTGQDDDGRGSKPAAKLSPAEAKAVHWIDVANKLTDIVEYGKQREKLLKEYGGAGNLPADVRYAFNCAKAACEPKDNA